MAAVGAHDDRLSILVTHASTYLGRRICRLLSESYGFHVYAIDSSPVQAVEPHYDDCSSVAETAYRASVAAAAAAASTPSSQKRAPPPAPAANGAHTVRRPKCNAPGAGNITRLVGDVRKVEDACAAVSGMHAVVHVAVLGGADGVANGALKQNACHSAHSSAFTNLTRACRHQSRGCRARRGDGCHGCRGGWLDTCAQGYRVWRRVLPKRARARARRDFRERLVRRRGRSTPAAFCGTSPRARVRRGRGSYRRDCECRIARKARMVASSRSMRLAEGLR